MKKKKNIAGRFLVLLKPYLFLSMALFLVITSISTVDAFFTYLSKIIIDQGIVAGNKQVVSDTLRLYGCIVIGQALLVFGLISLSGNIGERINRDLRKKMFLHLQKLSVSFYSRTPLGEIMSRVTSDSSKISELLSWGFVDSCWSGINIIVTMIFMFRINWELASFVLLLLPFMLLAAIFFQKRIIKHYRRSREVNSDMTRIYSENISGIKTIKALVREKKNLDGFNVKVGEMYKASYRAAWYSAFFLPVIQIIGSLGLGFVLWYGGTRSPETATGMTIGSIQAFVSYLFFMLWPIQELSRVFASMQNALAASERVFALLDQKVEIQDLPDARECPEIKDSIVFDHVDFSYTDKEMVLENFCLEIKQGTTIALVGATGAGKSTIINLVARFYEPGKGQILFDNEDYRYYTMASIQSKTGMVLQDPHLFNGTIRDNIIYSRLDASDEETMAAARGARVTDFLGDLEKGLDFEVGEGGTHLSFGQRQLVCIARILLANPEILIMDEATSSIDVRTENLIQQAIEKVTKQRTSIIIAHRLSTIINADVIHYLEKGRVVESGSHEDLIRKKGKYYQLYQHMELTEEVV
ncbi:MAG: ABC transporter ATP-binding protein [Spirochaetales bacterium]|nr:ABC transporter ATP-binding protein [Spirochaetales bacterium]